jgi:hypothetical protein
VEKENILEGKIDSLMRRLEKMEIEKERGSILEGHRSEIHMRRMWRVWPCPQRLFGGSQSARLHEEGRIAELPLRAR